MDPGTTTMSLGGHESDSGLVRDLSVTLTLTLTGRTSLVLHMCMCMSVTVRFVHV